MVRFLATAFTENTAGCEPYHVPAMRTVSGITIFITGFVTAFTENTAGVSCTRLMGVLPMRGMVLFCCLFLPPVVTTAFTENTAGASCARYMAVGVLSGMSRLLPPVSGYMNFEH